MVNISKRKRRPKSHQYMNYAQRKDSTKAKAEEYEQDHRSWQFLNYAQRKAIYKPQRGYQRIKSTDAIAQE